MWKTKEVPARDLIRELLEFVDEVVDPLGSRKEIEHIHTMLDRGTSADEQLRVYEESGGDFNGSRRYANEKHARKCSRKMF